MFVVLSLMFLGIFAGFLLRSFGFVKYLSGGISLTIYMLLFFLGVTLGANRELVSNLPVLGGRALFIAFMVVLGSCIAAKLVYLLFFKNDPIANINAGADNKTGGGNVNALRGSLVVVGFFVLGTVCGYFASLYNMLPDMISNGTVTEWVLYLLMIQVGMSISSDKILRQILKSIRPKLLLVPFATMAGTLIFAAFAAMLINRWSFCEVMAVGSGYAYYSLSSILITQLLEPGLGMQHAVELGTVALMANVFREILALLGAPLYYRYFGKFAPICVGGATTMDTTLPVITKVCGKELAFVSVFHGILVDFSVPLWVSFFVGFC